MTPKLNKRYKDNLVASGKLTFKDTTDIYHKKRYLYDKLSRSSKLYKDFLSEWVAGKNIGGKLCLEELHAYIWHRYASGNFSFKEKAKLIIVYKNGVIKKLSPIVKLLTPVKLIDRSFEDFTDQGSCDNYWDNRARLFYLEVSNGHDSMGVKINAHTVNKRIILNDGTDLLIAEYSLLNKYKTVSGAIVKKNLVMMPENSKPF